MPAIIFWALVIYEVIFIIQTIRAAKRHQAEQTEEAKKALDRETFFAIAGGAAYVALRMFL